MEIVVESRKTILQRKETKFNSKSAELLYVRVWHGVMDKICKPQPHCIGHRGQVLSYFNVHVDCAHT